jgi:hypothetical protein
VPLPTLTEMIRVKVVYQRMAAALLGCIPVGLIGSFFVDHFYFAGLKPGSVKSLIFDALLVAGVLLNTFKASDLLLRRGRQRSLPDVLERLVRRLESARPLNHLGRLASKRGQRRLLLFGIAQFVLIVAVDDAVDLWMGESMTMRSFGALVYAVGIALGVLSVAVVNRLGGLALGRWLVEDMRATAFLRRFALVFAGGVAVLGLYQGALWGAAYLAGAEDPFDILELPLAGAGASAWMLAIGLLAAWPPSVYFWILTQVGVAALATWALARLGARLLRVVRAAVERLVRYDRGAWAVLVLAATVALGVLRLMLARAG